jgi:hypothetical protein
MSKFKTEAQIQRIQRRIRDKREGKRQAIIQAERFEYDPTIVQQYNRQILKVR